MAAISARVRQTSCVHVAGEVASGAAPGIPASFAAELGFVPFSGFAIFGGELSGFFFGGVEEVFPAFFKLGSIGAGFGDQKKVWWAFLCFGWARPEPVKIKRRRNCISARLVVFAFPAPESLAARAPAQVPARCRLRRGCRLPMASGRASNTRLDLTIASTAR